MRKAGILKAFPSYLVVDRAAVCGVRAMAPRLHAGCPCTRVAARADRPPASSIRLLRPSRLGNAAGRLAESRSRTQTL